MRTGPTTIEDKDPSCSKSSPAVGIEEKVTGFGELKVTLTGSLSSGNTTYTVKAY